MVSDYFIIFPSFLSSSILAENFPDNRFLFFKKVSKNTFGKNILNSPGPLSLCVLPSATRGPLPISEADWLQHSVQTLVTEPAPRAVAAFTIHLNACLADPFNNKHTHKNHPATQSHLSSKAERTVFDAALHSVLPHQGYLWFQTQSMWLRYFWGAEAEASSQGNPSISTVFVGWSAGWTPSLLNLKEMKAHLWKFHQGGKKGKGKKKKRRKEEEKRKQKGFREDSP